jgi:hypothetical protein
VLGTCSLLGVAFLWYAFVLARLLGIALSSCGSAMRAPTNPGFPKYPIACVLGARLACTRASSCCTLELGAGCVGCAAAAVRLWACAPCALRLTDQSRTRAARRSGAEC